SGRRGFNDGSGRIFAWLLAAAGFPGRGRWALVLARRGRWERVVEERGQGIEIRLGRGLGPAREVHGAATEHAVQEVEVRGVGQGREMALHGAAIAAPDRAGEGLGRAA